jgi:hypothetical protein
MACVRKEVLIETPPANAWAALRDWGALHERLVPGFVVDARLDGEDRIVTFFNGAVARELLVDLDATRDGSSGRSSTARTTTPRRRSSI